MGYPSLFSFVHTYASVASAQGEQRMLHACQVVLRRSIENVCDEEVALSVPEWCKARIRRCRRIASLAQRRQWRRFDDESLHRSHLGRSFGVMGAGVLAMLAPLPCNLLGFGRAASAWS
ncbi:hypothetical protein WS68_10795 [Burkholderia sp. TSV86]|nr:hypothetical protein WS68_10795 [Burkholderia sp. TSV86]